MVWCPKYGHNVLGGKVAFRLGEVLKETRAEQDWAVMANEAKPDHVHLVVGAAPTDAPAEVVRQLEGPSWRTLRSGFDWLRRSGTLWSKSSFVAEVRDVSAATVRRSIENPWAPA